MSQKARKAHKSAKKAKKKKETRVASSDEDSPVVFIHLVLLLSLFSLSPPSLYFLPGDVQH
jgi:hypothetical protein